MNDDQIIDVILQFEGGFTNNPADRGGPTNYGITAAELGRWLGQSTPATVDQVHNLSPDDARTIYKDWYIAKPGFGNVTGSELKLVLVDSGVLHGTGRATKWLQQALSVTIDGVFGPGTQAALTNCPDQAKLAREVLGLRFRSIAGIVAADPSQTIFLRGWVNRAATLLDYI